MGIVKINKERRRHARYDTEMKIHFHAPYDIRTKVKFRIVDADKQSVSRAYSGLSKNISVEGLCFASRKGLKAGDYIALEIYIPAIKLPVRMEGEVRWSKKMFGGVFYTGARLISVNGIPVLGSIYYDKKYNVTWSVVLEEIFGSFSDLMRRLKRRR